MNKERKALLVRFDPHGTEGGLAELNQMLADGWMPLMSTSMGGGGTDSHGDGPHFAALVILEREEQKKTVSGFGQ